MPPEHAQVAENELRAGLSRPSEELTPWKRSAHKICHASELTCLAGLAMRCLTVLQPPATPLLTKTDEGLVRGNRVVGSSLRIMLARYDAILHERVQCLRE